jgi:stearoyl-CoA desaturase (delta-9 desaturase)|tara:strand:- start:913 stop:1656 length:744 start_codon:yes stop_codon:yes gene_type:complete
MRKAVLKQNKSWAPITLLAGQLIAQVTAILSLFLIDWTASTIAISLFVYISIMLGITMGYHRYYSHKAFKMPKWIEYYLLFFAHIAMFGPAITWVANHREHHKYVDTEKDPHSPHYRGWLMAYAGQVLIDIDFKLVRDLLKDNLHRMQVKYYWHVIIVYAAILFSINPMLLIYAWLVPAGFAKLIGSLVFTYSHRGKKANSDTWVGIITLGEGFHDKHHVNARTALWHPLDLGGQLIRMIDSNAKIQ